MFNTNNDKSNISVNTHSCASLIFAATDPAAISTTWIDLSFDALISWEPSELNRTRRHDFLWPLNDISWE